MKIKRLEEAIIPTSFGEFQMLAFGNEDSRFPEVAMLVEKGDMTSNVLVRIHSECMTGDLFHSVRCDCGEQLDFALEKVSQEGGVVVYLRQEGRGIGLINKLKAYNLQDKGIDTAKANVELGFQEDERTYESAIAILKELGINSVRLMTNNPLKIEALTSEGIEVTERVPIIIPVRKENERYLRTKQDDMGHLLDME